MNRRGHTLHPPSLVRLQPISQLLFLSGPRWDWIQMGHLIAPLSLSLGWSFLLAALTLLVPAPLDRMPHRLNESWSLSPAVTGHLHVSAHRSTSCLTVKAGASALAAYVSVTHRKNTVHYKDVFSGDFTAWLHYGPIQVLEHDYDSVTG